jgi:hypothetical protein
MFCRNKTVVLNSVQTNGVAPCRLIWLNGAAAAGRQEHLQCSGRNCTQSSDFTLTILKRLVLAARIRSEKWPISLFDIDVWTFQSKAYLLWWGVCCSSIAEICQVVKFWTTTLIAFNQVTRVSNWVRWNSWCEHRYLKYTWAITTAPSEGVGFEPSYWKRLELYRRKPWSYGSRGGNDNGC